MPHVTPPTSPEPQLQFGTVDESDVEGGADVSGGARWDAFAGAATVQQVVVEPSSVWRAAAGEISTTIGGMDAGGANQPPRKRSASP